MPKKTIVIISLLLVISIIVLDNLSEDTAKTLKLSDLTETINGEYLSDYTNVFDDVINTIKEKDKDFNPNDYRLTLGATSKNLHFVYFTYYIDNIETNKVYIIDFKDGEVIDINLAGIKEENLNNIDVVDKNILLDKIKEFENNKKAFVNNELSEFLENKKMSINKDGKLNIKNNNIISFNEKYYYDYNNDKLVYELIITENILDTQNQIVKEIKL